jgi:6-phosphogluconolactonase
MLRFLYPSHGFARMTISLADVKRYPDAAALAETLADNIAASLSQAIAQRGLASLVVSGGNSPKQLFQVLRTRPLDWSRVCVALADERWVEPTDAGSNEKLVRDNLLREGAAAARFTGLKNSAASPDLGAASAWETFARVPRPFDVTVLGMGDDGHTASLFPRSPNLGRRARSERGGGLCGDAGSDRASRAPQSESVRASPLAARVHPHHRRGQAEATFSAASGSGSVEDMPVRAVLRQDGTPVEVVWAP